MWSLPPVELGGPDHGLGLDPGVEGGDPLQDPLGLHFNLKQDCKELAPVGRNPGHSKIWYFFRPCFTRYIPNIQYFNVISVILNLFFIYIMFVIICQGLQCTFKD